MGGNPWDEKKWASYSTVASAKSREALYTRSSAEAPVQSGQVINAVNIKMRESRDSVGNPCSTPILIGLDVTGSMGFIAERIAKASLGILVGHILQRKPVADPHLLFMGIGDAVQRDKAPLQCTQFESDNRIVDQLTDIFLEGGGGGNRFESYDLAWAFAAYKTQTDAWEKRKQKGYLFTIGDEEFPHESSRSYLKEVLGNDCPQSVSPEELLRAAEERYFVFHITAAEGNYAKRELQAVEASWKQRIGKRHLTMTDHKFIAEVIVSAIAVSEGTSVDDAIAFWPQDAGAVVQKALSGGEAGQ
jgi:hypothetical protein